MARQDDIEDLLRKLAPLFLEIANQAQVAARDFARSDWARTHLPRTASVNQMAGTGRWRMVGDGIVSRQAELPHEVALSTSDRQHNQGHYYLACKNLAILLTVRRKPHPEADQPAAMQLQIEGVLKNAPVDFGDEIVVYLAVPPLGDQPSFAVATRGEETLVYSLQSLIGSRVDADEEVAIDLPIQAEPRTIVRSSREAASSDAREFGNGERR